MLARQVSPAELVGDDPVDGVLAGGELEGLRLERLVPPRANPVAVVAVENRVGVVGPRDDRVAATLVDDMLFEVIEFLGRQRGAESLEFRINSQCFHDYLLRKTPMPRGVFALSLRRQFSHVQGQFTRGNKRIADNNAASPSVDRNFRRLGCSL